jgi:hypothetical protein
MSLLSKVATVLEATADHLDEQMKLALVVASTPVPVQEKVAAKSGDAHIAELFQAVTGNAPDEELLSKLSSDEKLRDAFLKVAEHAAGAESLGGPGDRTDQPAEPKTAEERIKASEDRFGDWILNG